MDENLVASGSSIEVVAEMVAEQMGAHLFDGRLRDGRFGSGAEGIRTPGLRHAMAALCQLSYSPKSILLCPV